MLIDWLISSCRKNSIRKNVRCKGVFFSICHNLSPILITIFTHFINQCSSLAKVKGSVREKCEGGKWLTAKNNRFWLLLILLLSVASIRRKLIKTTFTEAHSVHTNSDLLTIYECVEKNLSMNLSCNIWMICLKLIWLFYDTSCILQLSEFVWTQRHSVKVVFNYVLLIDAIQIEGRLVIMNLIKSDYFLP